MAGQQFSDRERGVAVGTNDQAVAESIKLVDHDALVLASVANELPAG